MSNCLNKVHSVRNKKKSSQSLTSSRQSYLFPLLFSYVIPHELQQEAEPSAIIICRNLSLFIPRHSLPSSAYASSRSVATPSTAEARSPGVLPARWSRCWTALSLCSSMGRNAASLWWKGPRATICGLKTFLPVLKCGGTRNMQCFDFRPCLHRRRRLGAVDLLLHIYHPHILHACNVTYSYGQFGTLIHLLIR